LPYEKFLYLRRAALFSRVVRLPRLDRRSEAQISKEKMCWVEEFKLAGRSMGMARKRVFISYDYTKDKNYKNLVLAWDKNEDLDFSFYEMSVEVSVDSSDAAAIKRDISARISDSSHFLCLVGKYTHKSRWVDWEIKKAVELKKKIVAVQLEKNTTTPNALYGVGTSWALSFNFDVIKKALG
jgi:hypothetical protein